MCRPFTLADPLPGGDCACKKAQENMAAVRVAILRTRDFDTAPAIEGVIIYNFIFIIYS
jgi:hypothetical protein